MGIEKIIYPVHDDFFKLDVWNNNIKAIVEQFGTNETKLTEVEKKASDNTTNIGTLSNLTTKEKGSLVGAINEHNDELNILNTMDIQCFFQNANTFAVSTSTEDIVNCEGRGGTLTAENHRILILNAHYGTNCHSYLMIAKTAEELSYSELGSKHDAQVIKKHITKTGKTIYVAILKDPWVDNQQFSPYAHNMSVAINGVNENMMNYVEVPNLDWRGSGKLTPCLYDLADFILFSWINDDRIAGFYPSSDQYRSNIGSLSSLTTTEKGSLVGAVNEVIEKDGNILNGTKDFSSFISNGTASWKKGTWRKSTIPDINTDTQLRKREIVDFEDSTGELNNIFSKAVRFTSSHCCKFDIAQDGFVLVPGNKYLISMYARIVSGTTTGVRGKFQIWTNDKKNVIKSIDISSSWEKISIIVTMYSGTAGNCNVYFGIDTDNCDKSEISIDNPVIVDICGFRFEDITETEIYVGNIDALKTTDKTSLVGAVNEVCNKVVKISSANSTSISTISKSGYMTSGTIKYVNINGFCTVFFDKFYCLNTSGSLDGVTLVNSSLPTPVAGFKINDEITVNSSGKLIGGDNAGGSITFTGTVTYPLYSAL